MIDTVQGVYDIVMLAISLILGGGWVINYRQLKMVKSEKMKMQEETAAIKADNHIKLDSRWEKYIDTISDGHKREMSQITARIDVVEKNNEVLRVKIEKTELILDQKRTAIRKAFDCKVPNIDCPVLIKDNDFEQLNECTNCNPKSKTKKK